MAYSLRNIVKKDLFKASYFVALLSGVRMLVNLALSKIISLWLGATGLYLYSQLQSFALVLQNVSNGATNNGIIRYRIRQAAFPHKQRRLWNTAFSVTIWCSVVSGSITLIFAPWLSGYFFTSSDGVWALRILGITLVFTGFNQLILSLFNAEKRFRSIAIANNIQSVSLLLLVAVGAWYFGFQGTLIALALSQAVAFVVIFASYYGYLKPYFIGIKLQVRKADLKRLLPYSIMAVSSASVVAFTQIVARNQISEMAGSDAAGFWEALNRISNLYIFFLAYLFTGYFLPRFSEHIAPAAIRKQITQGFFYLLGLFLVIGLFLVPFRNWLIKLVFTPEFLVISPLLVFQIIGDFLKAVGWLFTNYLAALKKTRVFLLFEILANVLILLLLMVFLPGHGLRGVMYAYIISGIIQISCLTVYFCVAIFPVRLEKNRHPTV